MELLLIRHAQSQNNALPTEQRIEDPPITQVGREQAQLLAEWLATRRITRFVSSPFLRTLETTDYLRRRVPVPVSVETELHERGGCVAGAHPEVMVGRPGKSREEIELSFPEFQVASDINGEGWWRCRPLESEEQARRRARNVLENTRARWAGSNESVAFVMHAEFKLLLLELVTEERLPPPFNASVSRLMLTPTEARILEFNCVEHLPSRLLTC